MEPKDMKVFISWSGEFSRRVATELKKELTFCFDSVEPFMSDDIPKGAAWQAALANELNETRFGIICLTRENLKEPWIHFEAGALSKSISNETSVCTLLFDNLSHSDLPTPLSIFQCTLFTKKDFTELLLNLNRHLQSSEPSQRRSISESVVRSRLDSRWEEFHKTIARIRDEIDQIGDASWPTRTADTEETAQGKIVNDTAVAFSTALHLTGRTRIIYTCRSYFETPPFDCPGRNSALTESLTASSHIPVDEIETVGLCLDQYGMNILGTDESQVHDSITCSVEALRAVGGKQLANPRYSGEIFDLFLDNLIVIGENIFSNRLLYYFCHHLPWRHLTLEVIHKLGGTERIGTKGFIVRPAFNNHCGYEIGNNDLFDTNNPSMNWAIVTFVRNPFNPHRQILLLTGCGRLGQYLLLSALHHPEFLSALKEIYAFREQNDDEWTFFQIAIKGKVIDKRRRRQIARNWNFDLIYDLSNKRARPYFTDKSRHSHPKFTPGEPISDLSLLALVPWQISTTEMILETLGGVSAVLREAAERHFSKSDSSPINLHVTLFEFLHRGDQDDSSFISSIMREESTYIKRLRAGLAEAPQFMLRLRQTRITPYSVQILVDIYFDQERFRLPNVWGGAWAQHTLNSMDMIIEICKEAEVEINEVSSKFNVNRAPNPLHLTILRKNQHITERDWISAQEWATAYNKKIWGKIEEVPLVLAHARIAPFEDVRFIELK